MKKLVNFRPIFYAFVAFCLALFFARKIVNGNAFAISFCCVGLIIIFVLCIHFKKISRFLLIFVAFLVGVGYFYAGVYSFNGKTYVGTNEIVGRVYDKTEFESYYYIYLDSVKINNENCNKNILVYVNDEKFSCEIGNILRFSGEIKNAKLFELEQVNTTYYKSNIAYTTKALGKIFVSQGGKTLSETIDEAITNFTKQNFDTNTAWLFKAVLLGDKTSLSQTITSSFSDSGIGHLLAVSGLHVGFIVSVLVFIFSKFGLKQKIYGPIVFAILALYCYLCGFTPSVVRASVMSCVFLLAGICGRKYDQLNCLAIAGFLILLLRPLYVFDAGFLLSFFCVFCIFTLSRPFTNFFAKHLPKKLASSLGIIFAIQLGLIPIMSVYYNEFSLLSTITNLLCVPIFEIAYILAFLFLPICLLLPFMKFVLDFDVFLFSVITAIAQFISSIDFLTIKTTNLKSIFIVCFYIATFVGSGYLMFSTKLKLVVCSLIISIGAFISALNALPLYQHGLMFGCLTNTNSNYSYVLSYNNKIIVLGDNFSNNLEKYLQIRKISHIDMFFMTNYFNIDQDTVKKYGNFQIVNISDCETNTLHKNQEISYNLLCPQESVIGMAITLGDTKIYINFSTKTTNDINFMMSEFLTTPCSAVLSFKESELVANAVGCDIQITPTTILNKTEKTSLENWTCGFKNDILYNIRSLD